MLFGQQNINNLCTCIITLLLASSYDVASDFVYADYADYPDNDNADNSDNADYDNADYDNADYSAQSLLIPVSVIIIICIPVALFCCCTIFNGVGAGIYLYYFQ